MQAQEIFDKLKEEFADSIKDIVIQDKTDTFINIEPVKLFDICLYLRDHEDLLFDYLMCLSGVDAGNDLIAVYHLYSTIHKHIIVLKVTVPKENPLIPSVERVWRSADWHEREAYDMFGIIFEGHHNLIRILCPYDWEGFPLRKDYKHPEEYHGIKVPY